MDIANYKNGNNRYPVSTDTFDFIQEQIKLVYGIAGVVGENFIIKQSSAATEGIIVIDGEVLPLDGEPLDYIHIVEESEAIEAQGLTYEDARIHRYAQYTNQNRVGNYTAADFSSNIQQYYIPKGGIIIWSGKTTEIPSGWALCNGQNGTPDLRGRFVLSYGGSYTTIGDKGGEATHLLTAAESGLPAHSHIIYGNERAVGSGSSGFGIEESGTNRTTGTTGGSNATSAHNNMPPYYVLAYIMKL